MINISEQPFIMFLLIQYTYLQGKMTKAQGRLRVEQTQALNWLPHHFDSRLAQVNEAAVVLALTLRI